MNNDTIKNIFDIKNAFTLQSGKTGAKLKYRLIRSKAFEKLYNVYSFVKDKNMTYYEHIGTYIQDSTFKPIDRYKDLSFFAKPKNIRTIEWFFKNINDLPNNLFVSVEEV